MKSGQRRSVLQAPAIHALFILCSALLVVVLIRQFLLRPFGLTLTPFVFAVLHGVIAATIAYLRRMAAWWVPILFCFPPAAVLVNSLQLPPALFLGIFLFLMLLFWSTFRSQVPFYPSGLPVWNAVEALLPEGRALRVIDIGSGLGGAIMYLARVRPDSSFTGIELAPLPWLVSSLRARLFGSAGHFVRGDYTQLSFADYDVIFAYLSPAAMTALWFKARQEMQTGSLLLSYEFLIEGVVPDIVVYPRTEGPALYGWHM
ncbi:SAM-dependent methyltransferase [Herbaspirillum sp. Sphag1AN]|uniref:class I SAM-dependent methyltransferase n=1 Tax=unclassified Herbaspirillum TaxID=2624150 RepID=UPI001620F842|nr:MULTISPECIES: class I SAM-dependent methyltransferase [unclassified Herbaspirillum]MBB3210944.1 SAM-dependent methyltransferase [Herbaspirillum sp. Sphag1AN]MBB3244574.1 SAM-dependent methyltransferase [Herbaspirillum sp. Sphag64]